MDENVENGFDDFFGAYAEGNGNQTEPEESAQTTETANAETDDVSQEAAEAAESGEESEEENTNESEESGEEADTDADSEKEKHSFDNIKVNGEIYSVSYEDAPAWIQKGMDYDRVKGQLAEERQTNQDLRQRMDKHQQTIDVLEMISGDTGMALDELLHSIHKSIRMQQGESEKEAEANIRAAKAEYEAKGLKSQKEKQQTEEQDRQTRLQREYAEFRAANPDVNLDDELIGKLRPDVQSGMSMLAAYQKMQNRQQAEKIAELERQLAAKKQNEKNSATSPGSQRDSGGQRKRDAYDDFFDAYEK